MARDDDLPYTPPQEISVVEPMHSAQQLQVLDVQIQTSFRIMMTGLSKGLYAGLGVVLTFFVSCVSCGAGGFKDGPAVLLGMVFLCISGLMALFAMGALLYALQAGLRMVHDMWSLLQPFRARVTPTAALWLLLLPGVNFVGYFIAIVGLAVDMDHSCALLKAPARAAPVAMCLSFGVVVLGSLTCAVLAASSPALTPLLLFAGLGSLFAMALPMNMLRELRECSSDLVRAATAQQDKERAAELAAKLAAKPA